MEDLVVFLLSCVIWIVIPGIIIYIFVKKKRERRRKWEEERVERRRIRECGEVVEYFANHLGYLARQCISRKELGELIDSGISPEDLSGVIGDRIEQKQGIILGYQPFKNDQEEGIDVKLTQHFRDRHVYVIGKTGSGKTNLLRNMILQDLGIGNGIGVIAPEQEMITEEIIPFIPEERIDDVIYFNPADKASQVTFNPLQLDEEEDIDLKVDENLTIFKQVVHQGTGPRMEEILRQALYALVEREGTTLLDMDRLLDRNDPTFRNQIIRESQDENTIHFFRDTYPSFPKDSHLPITTRLGRLLRPGIIRNILCHPTTSLNFREAIDSGKILLFNLSDGILGEANSQLLGQLIVSKFQMAVMSRADTPKGGRRPFYLYIDEFQAFTSAASASYEKILSRARKYRLALILSHQQRGQIPLHLLKEIFGNVSTIVSFVVSKEDAGSLSGEFITHFRGEVENVPVEDLVTLKVGEAWCKIAQDTVFMKTYLAPQHVDYQRVQEVIERSRRNYGVPAGEYTTGVKSKVGRTHNLTSPEEKTLEDLDPGKVF